MRTTWLTALAVTAEVTDVRSAERAQRNAVVSGLSETAPNQLVLEENLADELRDPGPDADGEAAGRHAAARAAVVAALDALARATRRSASTPYFDPLEAGLDDAATSRMLGDRGCDVAQGYDFGRPLPPDRLAEWYEAHVTSAVAV